MRCNLNLASKEEILAALKKQQVSAEQVEGFDSMLALILKVKIKQIWSLPICLAPDWESLEESRI